MRKIGLTALLLLLAPSAPLWADAVFSVLPLAPTVSPGQNFSLTVGVSGITDLYGFQLDLFFNPAILSALSVSEGPFLASGGSTIFLPGTIDDTAGTVSANADILETAISGVTGGGTLLNFSFHALTPGSSSVQIGNLIALNSFGEGLTVSQAPSVVTVAAAAAPEPAIALLFALGLLLLTALKSYSFISASKNASTSAPHTSVAVEQNFQCPSCGPFPKAG